MGPLYKLIMIPDIPNPYNALFGEYIITRTKYLLNLVQQDDFVHSVPKQKKLMYGLQYALQHVDAWSITRELLLTAAPRMEQAGYRDEWLRYLLEGARLSRKYQDLCITADITFQIGYLFQLLGRLDDANRAFENSAAHYFQTNMLVDYAQSLNRQAYIARLQRRYTDAEKLVEIAIDILEQDHPARQLSYFVLGNIALDSKDGKLAESYFEQSLAICQQQGELRLIAQRLGCLGIAAYIQQEFTRARSYYEESITLFGNLQDAIQQAQMRMNMGNVYLDSGDPNQALILYKQAQDVISKVNDRIYLAMLAVNQGIAYRSLGAWEKAERSLFSAIAQWQQLNNRRSESNATFELAKAYLEQGDKKRAIQLFEEALKILSEIPNDPGYSSLYKSITEELAQTIAL